MEMNILLFLTLNIAIIISNSVKVGIPDKLNHELIAEVLSQYKDDIVHNNKIKPKQDEIWITVSKKLGMQPNSKYTYECNNRKNVKVSICGTVLNRAVFQGEFEQDNLHQNATIDETIIEAKITLNFSKSEISDLLEKKTYRR